MTSACGRPSMTRVSRLLDGTPSFAIRIGRRMPAAIETIDTEAGLMTSAAAFLAAEHADDPFALSARQPRPLKTPQGRFARRATDRLKSNAGAQTQVGRHVYGIPAVREILSAPSASPEAPGN